MFIDQDMTPDTDDGDVLFYPTEERRAAVVVDVAPEAPEPPSRPQAASRAGQVTKAQLNTLHALGTALYANQGDWDAKRPGIVERVTKGRTTSSKELWQAEAAGLITKLEERARVTYAAANAGELLELSGVELAKAVRQAAKAQPQQADAA